MSVLINANMTAIAVEGNEGTTSIGNKGGDAVKANSELVKGPQERLGKISRLKQLLAKLAKDLTPEEMTELLNLQTELGVTSIEGCDAAKILAHAEIIMLENQTKINSLMGSPNDDKEEELLKESDADYEVKMKFDNEEDAKECIGLIGEFFEALNIVYNLITLDKGEKGEIEVLLTVENMPKGFEKLDPLNANLEQLLDLAAASQVGKQEPSHDSSTSFDKDLEGIVAALREQGVRALSEGEEEEVKKSHTAELNSAPSKDLELHSR